MTVEADAAFKRFQQTTTAWLPYVEWASIVAVGVKSPEGLRLVSGRVTLYRAGAVDEPVLDVETEHILARRRFLVCTPDAAARLVDNVARGRIAIEELGEPFELHAAQVGIHAYPIRPPGAAADLRLPTCRVTGDRKFAALDAIGGLDSVDWELRGQSVPYYGLDELMMSLGLPTTTAMGDLAQLELIVAPPAIIAGDLSAIRDGRADVRIFASPKLRHEDVSISVKAFSQERGVGDARPLKFVKRERVAGRDDELLIFDGDVGDDSAVRVFLSVNALAVNQYWITDASRRLHSPLVAVEAFDESLAALDQHLLSPRGVQAERFEWAVGVLLYLLGFRVLRLGKGTPITDGPDMLALTAAGHVAVVECTVGHPDNKDKVAKVIQRAARVRDKLNKSGFGVTEVLAVVATPFPREELRDASADALRRGVLVLDGEALASLRQRVILPQNSDQLFRDGVAALSAAAPLGS